MYHGKYIPGNNYVLENGKTFKYNGRRFDGTGKYIGDSFTSTPTYDNDSIHQIYTNRDNNNDPNITNKDIRETSKLYSARKSYNKSVVSEKNRINNIIRQKQIREKRQLSNNPDTKRIKEGKTISNKLDDRFIGTSSFKKKKLHVPAKNKLFSF